MQSGRLSANGMLPTILIDAGRGDALQRVADPRHHEENNTGTCLTVATTTPLLLPLPPPPPAAAAAAAAAAYRAWEQRPSRSVLLAMDGRYSSTYAHTDPVTAERNNHAASSHRILSGPCSTQTAASRKKKQSQCCRLRGGGAFYAFIIIN